MRGAGREAGVCVVAAQAGMHGGRPDSRLGGQGMRGAHGEHVVHGRDAGRVEAQRLVEVRRALPSAVEGRACDACGARCAPGGREAGGRETEGGANGMHGEGPTRDLRGAGHAQSAR